MEREILTALLAILLGFIGGWQARNLFRHQVRERYRETLFARQLESTVQIHQTACALYLMAGVVASDPSEEMRRDISRLLGVFVIRLSEHGLFLPPSLLGPLSRFRDAIASVATAEKPSLEETIESFVDYVTNARKDLGFEAMVGDMKAFFGREAALGKLSVPDFSRLISLVGGPAPRER